MGPLKRLPATSLRGPRAVPGLGAFGNFLRFFADPIKVMLSNHRRFGPLSALADRDPAVVCAFGAEFNRIVLSDQRAFENWADLPVPAPKGSAVRLMNHALTAENGDLHRQHRRMMTPAFSRQSIANHRDRMAAILERRLGALTPGRVVDITNETTEVALAIEMECLFGVDSTGDLARLGYLALQFLRRLTSPATMIMPLPLPGLPYSKFLAEAEELAGRLRSIIAERRRQATEGTDMLSLLIRAHDEDGTTFTEDQLIGQAIVMFIAGHETTAQTLTWTLLLLSQHPDIMRAMTEELRATLDGAAPSVDQLGKLPRLDRVVKESMRLLPATPFLFLRRATGDFALGGVDLPAGAMILLSTLITHRDPERFPDPSRFVPDRWLAAEPGPYEYLPFGAGPRMCIGAAFANQAIRMSLAALLQRCHVELSPEARVSRRVQGITLGSKYPLPMRLVAPGDRIAVPAKLAGDIGELVTFSG